jgi:hypothetical protein
MWDEGSEVRFNLKAVHSLRGEEATVLEWRNLIRPGNGRRCYFVLLNEPRMDSGGAPITGLWAWEDWLEDADAAEEG